MGIVGVDEVGRGCLAGTVVCAAVMLPDYIPDWLEEVKDSKKLSPKKRQKLSDFIISECDYSIRESSVVQIDHTNILRATLVAMRASVLSLSERTDRKIKLVLVDGTHTIPNLQFKQEAIKNGDNIHKSIAAASIIAKVYRDNYMVRMDVTHPGYGFAKHKGYGTEEHREAIMVYGPCPIHRKTFKGVYEYVKS